jgi:asparagine N-glycosylation enzyme membrane subunit Stt3
MFVLIGETLTRMDDKLLCDEDGHIFTDLDTYYINKLIESLFTNYDHSQTTKYFVKRN